jgi:hypothetical protein
MGITTAEMAIPNIPMTPSFSPHCAALAAPTMDAAVPRANPFINEFFIPSQPKIGGPINIPMTAVIKVNTAVSSGDPPSVWDTDTAIGAVTDLGAKDAMVAGLK